MGDTDDSDLLENSQIFLTTALSSTNSEETVSAGSSRLSVIFLIINAALGAGLLNFPQAFDQAGGILTAMSVQAVMLVWIMGALVILAYCADQSKTNTLQDVLEWACGSFGRVTGSLCIILYCFGTCITFLIIIGDQYDRVLSSVYGSDFCHYWYMNRDFTIATSSAVFILPFCFSRRIDFLKYASSLGVLEVIYVVGLIVYEKYRADFAPCPIKNGPDYWTDVFLVIPVICFAYQCHVSVIPIYSCLAKRNLKNFTICASCAIGACFAAYTLAGVYGYLTFGSCVTGDILESYDGSNPSVIIGILSIAIKTYTTYPILLFCGREAVSSLWCYWFHSCATDVAVNERTRRIIIASVWFVFTIALAVITPGIGPVISLLGSLAAFFIFIFPGVCLMQSTLRKDPCIVLNKDRFIIIISSLFILFGCFLAGVVFVQTISEKLMKGSDHKSHNLCT